MTKYDDLFAASILLNLSLLEIALLVGGSCFSSKEFLFLLYTGSQIFHRPLFFFLFFYIEKFHTSRKSWKASTMNTQIRTLHLDWIVNILPDLLFSPPHACVHKMTFHPWVFPHRFPENKDIVLRDYNKIIMPKNINSNFFITSNMEPLISIQQLSPECLSLKNKTKQKKPRSHQGSYILLVSTLVTFSLEQSRHIFRWHFVKQPGQLS